VADFSEQSRKKKLIELLRWIGVLPAAWLAGLVGQALTFALVNPFLSGLSYEGSDRWVRHLVGRILSEPLFVIAGTQMAPRFPFATTIVLAAGTIAYDALIHGVDDIPVFASAVTIAAGALVSFFLNRAKGERREFGAALIVIPVLLCALEIYGPARSVFGTSWPVWMYYAGAGLSGTVGGAVMATHRLRGMLGGFVAALGALAGLVMIFVWRLPVPRGGFIAFGAAGALPGLALYYLWLGRPTPARDDRAMTTEASAPR
jgi:hypothetical protein